MSKVTSTWLKARLIELSWDQKHLADLADMPTSILSKFLIGTRDLEPDRKETVERIIAQHSDERRDIGQWINDTLAAIGMTKRALSNTLGLSYATIRAWCDGRTKPYDKNLIQLDDLFARISSAPSNVLVPPIFRTYGDCKDCPYRARCISRVNIYGMPTMCEPLTWIELDAAFHAGQLSDLVWFWGPDVTLNDVLEAMLK